MGSFAKRWLFGSRSQTEFGNERGNAMIREALEGGAPATPGSSLPNLSSPHRSRRRVSSALHLPTKPLESLKSLNFTMGCFRLIETGLNHEEHEVHEERENTKSYPPFVNFVLFVVIPFRSFKFRVFHQTPTLRYDDRE